MEPIEVPATQSMGALFFERFEYADVVEPLGAAAAHDDAYAVAAGRGSRLLGADRAERREEGKKKKKIFAVHLKFFLTLHVKAPFRRAGEAKSRQKG